MKKLKPRLLIGSAFCLAGIFVALGEVGLSSAQSKAQIVVRGSTAPTANASGGPDVVRLVGPIVSNTKVRDLPYIPPTPQILEEPPTRYRHSERSARSQTSGFSQFRSLFEKIFPSVPSMPLPLLTFKGIDFTQTKGNASCYPPDPDGDVGPNHYVQAVNTSFRVFNKSGNPLTPVTTFNSFFAPLGGGNPCGNNQNHGDPFVFYDHIADRWVITDFALVLNSLWECIGVSQTADPAGTYYLYALQHDPMHPMRFGDYPKFALWPDAYYLTMNLWSDPTPSRVFVGVRVYALDRASMISGGPTNAIGFTIGLAGLGYSYSLVPASFRTGSAPPAGEHEFLLAVDSNIPGEALTQIHGWYFQVDFINPANSTIGLGPDHTPNAEITVNPFIPACTAETCGLVPQLGTSQGLATMGDKIMTPLVYQNRNGTASLWAAQTTMLNFPDGPTAVSWYQFDVTGGSFPAFPLQQQDWTNGNDGLWRWMPSIAVDQHGNMAIGYSTSSPSMYAGIRYAGRLASDPLNNLGQGEAIMTNGAGAQIGDEVWGDYTMTTIDPADGITFWHTNEYYETTSEHNWSTRVGKFRLPRNAPTPRPHPSPHPRP
jgi:hypothetical protein